MHLSPVKRSCSVQLIFTFVYLPPCQNPKDCSKAKKLVCNINKGCGYGCQLHHVVYCFMIAYGTQRTLILESQNWRYATGGWETVFRPVSETCTDRSGISTGHWSGKKSVQLVRFSGLNCHITRLSDFFVQRYSSLIIIFFFGSMNTVHHPDI